MLLQLDDNDGDDAKFLSCVCLCVWRSNHLLRETAAAASNRTQFVINVIFCHLSFHFSKLRNEMCHTQLIWFHSQSHYMERWRHLKNMFIIANGAFSNEFNSSYWASEWASGRNDFQTESHFEWQRKKPLSSNQPDSMPTKSVQTSLIMFNLKFGTRDVCCACIHVVGLSCLFIGSDSYRYLLNVISTRVWINKKLVFDSAASFRIVCEWDFRDCF